MKILKITLRIIVLLLVVLFLALFFAGGPVIKNAINTVGPKALGVPVSVENVEFKPLRGLVKIDDMKIGNPEGFDTKNLFTMEKVLVDIDMSTVLKKTIVVNNVHVIGPNITYEQNLTGNNIGTLLDQLGGDKEEKPEEEKKEEDKPEEKAEKKEGGKKVVIDYFVLDDCQVNASLPGMGGVFVPIPLPKLELKDIGKNSEDGATIIDVIGNIFSAIFAAVGDVVLGSAKLLGSGVKAVGTGAVAVGGAAVDGVTAVGGAAVGGVAAVGKGVAGIFGVGSKDEDKEGTEAELKEDEKADEKTAE